MDARDTSSTPESAALTLGECLAYSGRMVRWLTDGETYWIGGEVRETTCGDDYQVAIVSTDRLRVEWAHPTNLILVGAR